MSRWTDEELRELITLWPTNSASQIAKLLHRQRAAISRKAMLLRREGLLSPDLPKHFKVDPAKRSRSKPRMVLATPPPNADDSTTMRSVLELD